MAKQLLPSQCDLLHQHFPPDECCLCKANARIKELEEQIKELYDNGYRKPPDRPQREKIAEATYHFVHRGKTHMDWNELPYKWGKKAYYEFADQILAFFRPKGEPPLLSDEKFDNWYKWFVGLFNRNQLDSEKNAIKHLLQAQREADIKFYEGTDA